MIVSGLGLYCEDVFTPSGVGMLASYSCDESSVDDGVDGAVPSCRYLSRYGLVIVDGIGV